MNDERLTGHERDERIEELRAEIEKLLRVVETAKACAADYKETYGISLDNIAELDAALAALD